MRNAATVLESYFADCGHYPPGKEYCGDFDAIISLTSPNPYISYIPREPNQRLPAFLWRIYYPYLFCLATIVWLCVLVIYAVFTLPRRTPHAIGTLLLCSSAFIFLLLLAPPTWTTVGTAFIRYSIAVLCSVGDFWHMLWQRFTRGVAVSPVRLLRQLVAPTVLWVVLVVLVLGPGFHRAVHPDLYVETPFRYATNGIDRWILVARGPDGDFDFDPMDYIRAATEPFWFHEPYPGVLFIYDPSNGTDSSGDIVRCGP